MSWGELERPKEERELRARRARALLEDSLLLEVLATARDSYIEHSLEGESVEVRERARAAALALGEDGALLQELRAIITGGEHVE